MMEKCFCKECGWQGTWDAVLKGPNPFFPGDEIRCWREASCGSPHPDGYRWSCYDHSSLKRDATTAA